ncbi:transient receptor potential channel pyrexia-like isoform X2 [Pectinophora gossypiella]|uniref:transient receptor potential channel pyrexia-like isoform X2 n=1 Tax=Pectinophora gossypiella TaxID=13191 RepID=UPI00214EDC76|nr:transient receptor potential channel pyrexia-like isoform X2 [Pectinophora gossypiella]
MEMSVIKDVEAGIPEGCTEERDTLQPLLDDRVSPLPARLRPPRPVNLGPLDVSQNLEWRQYPSNSSIPDETPSIASTANNTPLGDVPETWPKKWRRSDRRLRRLNTELLEAIEGHNVEEVERLLNAGANPNATCRLGLISSCHFAALAGGEALALLLKFGAEKHRLDKLGRTPLHLAAWAGNARQMAILLDFPEDMQNRVDSDSMSSEAEEDVKKLCPKTRDLANLRCDLGEVKMLLPKNWRDNIDHNCRDITGTIPLIQPGWTPLHVASACARRHCTRLLLAAGADPNISDVAGRTPLDVAGFAFYYDEAINSDNFTEVIKMLIKAGGTHNTMKARGLNDLDTPIHTAVELENKDAMNELLNIGASIACLNTAGLTPLHVCVRRELELPLQVLANYGNNDADPLAAMVDVKDREGHTVLQAAVEASWVPGVCIALEAGADVTLKANDGETPIHSAAALGNIDVLNEILSVAKQRDFIDCQNDEGETPLFKAIVHGHKECLRALLNEGASLKITLPGDVNVLHAAAECGQLEILKELLIYDEDVSKAMINTLTAGDRRGFGPIHFAVSNNHTDCVDLLLSRGADIRLRTTCSPHKESTPLHIAAVKNYLEIAKIILDFDKTTIHEVNSMGWFPLHTAAHHGSRDVIALLLREGADLSVYTDGPKKYRRTAIDMIINNLSKPTDFMEEIFDSYIQSNSQNLQDPNCEITVDYSVLMPTICEMEQMKVIQALMKTGNRYGQKRLLVHPLVESFLYLKWKALLPFFYTIIVMYALFVGSLTTFTVSVFFYKDTHDENDRPMWLNAHFWGYAVYTTIFLLLIQELLYMNIKSSRYFVQLETWVKFSSIGLATILPPAVLVTAWSDAEWPRHVATVALLLSWVELMFLLSRFPNWGYYVLMFGKVASNVIKILATFLFLVIGFSLSFMIQFKSISPFEGPWASLVKTIVMMTSEFDYEALFDEDHSKELANSLVIIRLIFLVFLILAAIVLMNLMVGVAVNDINDLEILGNIRRLAKQVEFLGTLDTLVYNRVFSTILPKRVNNSIKKKRKVICVLTLSPGKPRWRHYKILSSRLRDAIFDKAVCQKKQTDDEMGLQRFKSQMEEMYEAIVKQKERKDQKKDKPRELLDVDRPARNKMRHDEIIKHLNEIDDGMSAMKEQMTSYAQESKSPVEELNVKMDQMSIEIEVIKQFLSRLESKLGAVGDTSKE